MIDKSTSNVSQKFLKVNRRNPCPICGKPDWCLVSPDGKAAICARIQSEKPTGNAGWLHIRDGEYKPAPIATKPQQKQAKKADTARINAVYSALLSELNLSDTHKQKLTERGLSDADIERYGYKTLPSDRRLELPAILQKHELKLAGVPGFYLNDNRAVNLAGPAGILIPIRNFQGEIYGMQVRADDTSKGKYRWISSKNYLYGVSSGAPIHVTGPLEPAAEVWITEGALKADIATLKLQKTILAVAGVGNWAGIIPVINKLKPCRVIAAFDMDKNNNQAVRLHLDRMTAYFLRRYIRVFEADWQADYKGIDDILTAEVAK